MSRSIAVVIYGATGYTGKFIARYFHEKNAQWGLSWALAGRSEPRLNAVLQELAGIRNEGLPSLIVADINAAPVSLEFFKNTRLVLNCTGPFRFLGEPIVKACIANGTHYMDITGEPYFIESMFFKYSQEAKNNNCIILHSCAFDSVPSDIGTIYTIRQFPESCCASIESFIEMECPHGYTAHSTTYECAVHGMTDTTSLKALRKQIEETLHPPKIEHMGPKLERRSGFFFEERLRKHCLPFMGADASVVRLTQRIHAMTRGLLLWPQIAIYAAGWNSRLHLLYMIISLLIVGDWSARLTTTLCGAVVNGLAMLPFGKDLLLSYPGIFTAGTFSHSGPSQEQLDNTNFKLTFFAKGFTDLSSRDKGHHFDKAYRCFDIA